MSHPPQVVAFGRRIEVHVQIVAIYYLATLAILQNLQHFRLPKKSSDIEHLQKV